MSVTPRPMPVARVRRSAALIAAAAMGLAASPAAAQDGHSLALTGPSSARPGQAIVLQAGGTVPSDAFFTRYVNVYALPAAVVATCPGTYQGALQIKDNTTAQGGETVALVVPAEGSFTLPIAYTPSVAGRFLLCGYLHDLSESYAVSGHLVTVGAAGAAGAAGAPPRNLARPKLRRAGARLVCTRGAWSGAPRRYAYGWRVNGRRKAGATRATLRITADLRGRTVRCSVTATNARGSRTALSNGLRVRR